MLKRLGLTKQIIELNPNTTNNPEELARVVAVHKDRYLVRNSINILNAEITGNLRFSAQSSLDFPAVGDWVQIVPIDKDTAIIRSVLKRYSTLERKTVGKYGENQLIATNINTAFIVMAVNQDFKLNRLDRYISICNEGQIEPIVVLTKIDLLDNEDVHGYIDQITQRHKSISVIPVSIFKTESIAVFKGMLESMNTYCFIGSSGVGKSTLVNVLLEENMLKTNALSTHHQKGKHTTTHRELFTLPNGSMVIDTPGMREVGLGNQTNGIEATFETLVDFAKRCKYGNCTHTNESNCGVLDALDEGQLDEDSYSNYLKLKKEQEHYSQSRLEKKHSHKKLTKMIRKVQRQKRNRKY